MVDKYKWNSSGSYKMQIMHVDEGKGTQQKQKQKQEQKQEQKQGTETGNREQA